MPACAEPIRALLRDAAARAERLRTPVAGGAGR